MELFELYESTQVLVSGTTFGFSVARRRIEKINSKFEEKNR